MRRAVILAGGSGTRLWPASRQARPKQLLALGGGETLLAATARRLRAAAPDVMIVTAAEHAGACAAEVPAATVVAEPLPRNTAAALGLAAVHAAHRDADAVLGAFPADHHVADEVGFGVAIERAWGAAERGDVIATIGVVPTRAETGFGYLELGGDRAELGDGVRTVARFVEKPEPATAAGFAAGGRHLWNAGMFFVRARRLLAEIERWMPATGDGLREISDALRGGGDEAAARATAAVYPRLPSVSIDHGVMEHAADVVAVPGAFGWSDVGSWQAVAALVPAGERGHAAVGDAVVVDAAGNLTYTDDGVIALVGVSNLAVVRAGDAVLVVPLDRAQDVKAVVAALAAGGRQRYL
ncbi:MAG TPA: sugar phosphate nucleotidyltransferase [Kofleriaceae bacterium]|nr:sugar phosphate nucleotidyltransferase [Kofleriaceae bacterium]